MASQLTSLVCLIADYRVDRCEISLEVLRHVVASYLKSGQPMPKILRLFAAEELIKEKPFQLEGKGNKNKKHTADRNSMVARFVEIVGELEPKLPLTSGKDSKVSICGLIEDTRVYTSDQVIEYRKANHKHSKQISEEWARLIDLMTEAERAEVSIDLNLIKK